MVKQYFIWWLWLCEVEKKLSYVTWKVLQIFKGPLSIYRSRFNLTKWNIAVDRKLSIVLYFLKNAESRQMTANTFGNPLSKVSNQSMKFVKQFVRI